MNGIKENEECEFAICQITRLFVLRSWKEMIVDDQRRSSVSDFVKDSKLLYRRETKMIPRTNFFSELFSSNFA